MVDPAAARSSFESVHKDHGGRKVRRESYLIAVQAYNTIKPLKKVCAQTEKMCTNDVVLHSHHIRAHPEGGAGGTSP